MDGFIADLTQNGTDGNIDLVVNADGAYSASYRGDTHQFHRKPRTAVPTPYVSIASLIPNPAGDDRSFEEVELRGSAGGATDMNDWFLRDATGRVWALASLGGLPAGATVTIKRAGMAMSLDNGGDTIELVDNLGAVVDRLTYGATAVGVRVTH